MPDSQPQAPIQIDSDIKFTRSPLHVDAYIINDVPVTATALATLARVVALKGPRVTLRMLQDIEQYGSVQEQEI